MAPPVTPSMGPTAENVNLMETWNSLLAAFESVTGMDGLLKVAAWVGLILIIASIIGFLWTRRQGGSPFQGMGRAISGSLIMGLILIAPKVAVPVILFIVQTIINIVVTGLGSAGVG